MKPQVASSPSRRRFRVSIATAAIVATATALLSATPAVAAVNHNPIGSLDAVGTAPGIVAVRGWALDPDNSSWSISTIVTVGGTQVGKLTANGARPDVNRVKHVAGNHGYGTSMVTNKTGRQQLCVVALNIGPGANVNLGCKTVTIPAANPVGSFDAAAGGTQSVSVTGWTFDPSSSSASTSVSVAVGGTTVGTLAANGARTDVNQVMRVGGNHGFAGSLPVTQTGVQSVCITAINIGPGVNSSLGCRTVTISAPGAPAGTATSASSTAPSSSPSEPLTGPGSASGQAMPVGDVTANGRTWHQFYSQDFTKDAPLGTFLQNYPDISAYNGFSDTSGQGLYSPNKVLSVSGGVLDFNLHSENGQPLVSSISPDNYAPMTTGRVSIRFKTTYAPGYKFVGILWPKDDVWNEGEIDWPEADLGGIPRPASAIPGTYANGNMRFLPAQQMFAPTDTTGWHTATTEWDHGIVRFYWDGQLITSVTNAVPTTPFRVALQAETWIDQGPVPLSADGHVDIDWISMWN